jgi:hypothetical protein
MSDKYVSCDKVLACARQPADSKYPYRLKVMRKRMQSLGEGEESVETSELKNLNSMLEVPKGTQLLVFEGGVITEREGRTIKGIVEWERVVGLIPVSATTAQIIAILAETAPKSVSPEKKGGVV